LKAPGFLPEETKQKIIEAFEVFDEENVKMVDVREIGAIMRSLGKHGASITFIYYSQFKIYVKIFLFSKRPNLFIVMSQTLKQSCMQKQLQH
jgi:hypothetical protein